MSNLTRAISGTASVTWTEVRSIAQDLSLPADEYPAAEIIEILDSATCPLCQALHGQTIRRGTPEWERYRLPSHVNCRRTFAYIPADEVDESLPQFIEPADNIIREHGHFIVAPTLLSGLRAPVYADRRQFVVRTIVDIDTRALVKIIDWLVPISRFVGGE